MLNKALNFCAVNSRFITFLFFLFALLFPVFFKTPYTLRVATMSLMFTMITLGLNIVTGYMGQTSFGTAAFWGIGAYTAAILTTRFGFSSLIVFLSAAITAGLASLFLGLCVLKLKGYYLAIVTLGFCEIVRLIELNWMSLTRGPLGIMNIPIISFFGVKFKSPTENYYLILILLAITTYIVSKLMNSRFGRVISSIREDEIATQSMGINTVSYKIQAFIIYAIICGVAGAFYAQYMRYIDPTMFTANQSIEMVIMVIFGGMASVPGSYLGAIFLTVLPELLRDLLEYRMLIYGFIMVIMVTVKPEGLLGNINLIHIKQQISLDLDEE